MNTSPQIDNSGLRTLLDELLDDQQRLQTPVALFSSRKSDEPDMQAHYHNLIPLSQPAAHEQYAFEVSLDRCTGCKACVSACNSLNGLDAHESWRDVGLLLGGNDEPRWQQTLTSACHHCESPECLHGCPVGAYEKDADTGIVRHLDDQCIGCSYCILKCPYDVPKYSPKRGIVRKCDMCHQRLAAGEAPACVQACPTEAIRIVKVNRQEKSQLGKRGLDFIPGAPEPSITRPTTRYVGRAVPQTARPADEGLLRVEHAHNPLVLMLTLTQAGTGLVSAGFLKPEFSIPGMILFFLGLGASILHLGRPLGAWRFFLGLKKSWLSREILAFSLLAPLILLQVLLPRVIHSLPQQLTLLLNCATLGMCIVALTTSVMIYADTKRQFWKWQRSGWKFLGSFLLFASLAWSPWTTVLLVLLKLSMEAGFVYRHFPGTQWSPDRHSARVQWTLLQDVFLLRSALLLATVLVVFISPIASAVILLIAEVLEKRVFFQAVYAPRMTSQYHRS